jgi:hypothetical protein
MFFFLVIFCPALFGAAFFLAYLEINVEGKYGWAWRLPTWYRTSKPYQRVMHKPLTGYHLALGVLLLILFHLPLLSLWLTGGDWSVGKELFWFSIYLVWVPLWDLLWFVLNPFYGIEDFKKENVPWHSNDYWLWDRVPVGIYLVPVLIAFGFSSLAIVFGQESALKYLFWLVVVQAVLLMFVIVFVAPSFREWHYKMLVGRDARKEWNYF